MEQPQLIERLPDPSALGSRAIVGRHRLCQQGLFDDSTLKALLDEYPRQRLQAFTMGTDALRWKEWEPVDTGSMRGEDIFQAVIAGRLWLNILRVDLFDERYRQLIEQLYVDLAALSPQLEPVLTEGTLLISSPHAMVYYHADATANILWHIRGQKRIWIYPACDFRFISQELMEDIFASVMDEEVPYEEHFDQHALTFDLQPGDVVSWPLNAPHRIVNAGMVNVSLSTYHQSEATERRKLIYLANRFFRRTLHLPMRSIKETGPAAASKRLLYRAYRRAGLVPPPPGHQYLASLTIDPTTPMGVVPLPTPRKAAFST